MLAIGPPLLVGGALGGSLSIDGGTKNKSFLYTTAIIVGGIFTVASIPLLISAYYNRHKAKRLEMSLSAMEMPKYIDKSGYVPTLKISINF